MNASNSSFSRILGPSLGLFIREAQHNILLQIKSPLDISICLFCNSVNLLSDVAYNSHTDLLLIQKTQSFDYPILVKIVLDIVKETKFNHLI